MRGAEGVVDVDVAERGQSFGKGLVVLFFLRMETQVLQQQHVARLHRGDHLLDRRADAVRRESHFLAQESLEPLDHGRQAVPCVRLALGPAQVRAEDDLGAFVHGPVDRREGGADAGVVGDLVSLVERDVEVGADDHALVAQIHVLDRPLVNVHGRSMPNFA